MTDFKGWRHTLDQPRTWTPLFFLDEAVALAAGHRPCGLCRRSDYRVYRDAVTAAVGADAPILAVELNRRLASERLSKGRGLERAGDRKLSWGLVDELPTGTVVADEATRTSFLVDGNHLRPFSFSGWGDAISSDERWMRVLTPPTSLAALSFGYRPKLSIS